MDTDGLKNYSFKHPRLGHTVEAKLFIGEELETTGSEISFCELPPKTTISFLHKHHENEEIYIFLKGTGQYQADDEVFSVEEGTIVKVLPDGARTLCNEGDTPLHYMVIQSKAKTLSGYDIKDGYRVKGEIKI